VILIHEGEIVSDIKNYTPDLQKLFVQFMMTDPELYTRVRGIIKPEYFDRSIRPVVLDYAKPSDD
jgi:hypothetical protein